MQKQHVSDGYKEGSLIPIYRKENHINCVLWLVIFSDENFLLFSADLFCSRYFLQMQRETLIRGAISEAPNMWRDGNYFLRIISKAIGISNARRLTYFSEDDEDHEHTDDVDGEQD